MTRRKHIFYAQSGGVTAVINASACGVIEASRQHAAQIGDVYVGKNGIIGALTEELIDTSTISNQQIAALRHTPSGAFGSCRYKLQDINTDRIEYERLIAVFKAHDIGYFLYNGGGDSADTCHKISQLSQSMDYPLQAIHIPKTIDNDLPVTDNCPGFGSVAKYIAISTLEASLDVCAMAKTSTKVFVLEAMGRHAGWIAAAAGLVNLDRTEEIPLLILLPEVPLQKDRFLQAVQQRVDSFGYCTIVVSEGVRDATGRRLAEQAATDAFGHAQLGGAAPIISTMIQQALGYKYHWAVADYLQRSARHIASRTDVEQAYALGVAAVEMALAGDTAIMPIIHRLHDDPYQWEIRQVALDQVANVEKTLPAEFIREDGFGITPACLRYLAPLIYGEDYPPYHNGLPNYAVLPQRLMEKKLPPYSVKQN